MKVEIVAPWKIQDKPYQKLIDLYLERCPKTDTLKKRSAKNL